MNQATAWSSKNNFVLKVLILLLAANALCYNPTFSQTKKKAHKPVTKKGYVQKTIKKGKSAKGVPIESAYRGPYNFTTDQQCTIKLPYRWPNRITKVSCVDINDYECIDGKMHGNVIVALLQGKDTVYKYAGGVSNGYRHGTGATYFMCVGDLCLNKFEGQYGIGVLRNGKEFVGGKLVFEGSFDENDQRLQGKEYLSNGNTYTGSFKNGKEDGEGELVRQDGSWHKGGFRQGKRHGYAESRTEGGFRFYGNWTDDVADGEFKIRKWTYGGLKQYEAKVFLKNGKQVGDIQVIRDDFDNAGNSNTYSSSIQNDRESTPKEHTVADLTDCTFEHKESSTWGYGEIEKWKVYFRDGVKGYICYSPKKSVWYIYNGAGATWNYINKDKAIKAVYLYKKYDEISTDGKQ